MKWFIGLLISIVFFSVGHIGGAEGNNKEPFINQELALKIGKLVLEDKYPSYMKGQKPLQIVLEDSIWVVSGKPLSKDEVGKRVYIEIDSRNCKIYKVGFNRESK